MARLIRLFLLISVPLEIGLLVRWWLAWSDQQFLVTALLSDVALWTGGTLTGIAGVWTACWMRYDTIWEQRQKQARYDAVADRQRFLQRLDHELKNPLMIMQAVVENALAEVRGGVFGVTHETLTVVNTQTVRMSRLVNDLRKLSEVETIPLDITPVDLDTLLQEVFTTAQEHPDAAKRRFSLRIPEAPWPLPTIKGDWDLLFLALYNLLENGIKYSVKGDLIELKAREEGEFVYIEVADTGTGIAEADLPHIWDELHRGDNGRGLAGSGLGLALTRSVIKRHGGEVSAKSRLQEGSEMTVMLPIKSKGLSSVQTLKSKGVPYV